MGDRSSTGRRRLPPLLLLTLLIGAILLPGGEAEAGSCARGIDRMQARLDRALENRAADGPFAPESARAMRSRQPTPATIAAAESRYDGWPAGGRAVAALARARRADAAGDHPACRTALRVAEREIVGRTR